MKKIINNPANFVEESIDGLIKSHPEVYALAKDNNRVITRANKALNKVGIVTGGGSGHLPVFTGYVGKGFLDACAIGSVFASPSVEQMVSAIAPEILKSNIMPAIPLRFNFSCSLALAISSATIIFFVLIPSASTISQAISKFITSPP